MRIAPILTLALLVLVSVACSDRVEREPVVIHVYRDPAATVVESALLTVGAKQLRSSSGQAIMVATMEPKSYAKGLAILGHQYHPELIIFNSIEDGEKAGIGVSPQSSVATATRQFYLVIPEWVPKERRPTTELVLVEIRKELQKGSEPTTAVTH